ncbi:NADPH:adrenodoxin oxidoreductase, mitochondrial-like [Dendronephthya gigantea]|uniref:NADPH:adrenodoxin oxidoreductase, mitochondrial-like n=1 Tax=Dendronephthya gigantea TaxID=151771 RepID=UPI00106D4EDC|nr:NADPH:adrenodoxin oxidoreductase, mitochondrial-like [Dendronephthya gigantea]
MVQFQYQLLRPLTRHGGLFRRHINYSRSVCRKRSFTTDRNERPAVCIVGSGPAGFYTSQYLLKLHENLSVDIYDKLPVPFGLVRFGVAPDHPETKNCINQFTTTAKNERCRFVGNVHIGKDVSLGELKAAYDVVILCYGAENDRKLQVPGEEHHGVYSARHFVEWYNGLPASSDLKPDLSSETAVIIGQGNVALDVARILLKPVEMLEKTDICEHALDLIRKSKVKRVYVVGRRGPLQISFTIKELREMTKLPGCRSVFSPEDFQPIREMISEIPRQKKRLFELLCNTALNTSQPDDTMSETTKEFKLLFRRSPVEIMSSDSGRVSGIKFEINNLKEMPDGTVKANGSGKIETLNCGLIFRSIGYRSVVIDDEIPFDGGVVSCESNDGHVSGLPGVYCCGWVRTGPTGVILSTLNEGRATAKIVVSDLKQGKFPRITEKDKGFFAVNHLLESRGIKPVSFKQWERIDKHEQELGLQTGKPREKIVENRTLLNLAHEVD